MFSSLLIANRGEIACRVIRTARRLGLRAVAVYSSADATARHVELADEAVAIGPARAADSYLNIGNIIVAAKRCGAQAIHPGYGFLSENADFAAACARAGLVFVGPGEAAMRAMGDKIAAKALMAAAGVPVVPGYHGADQGDQRLRMEADRVGYPLLLKASAGGGGKGMRIVHDPAEFSASLAAARREALGAFGDDRMLIERFVDRPRHIEVQVFADAYGQVVHLHERDCSVQRRHQKVIEEAPAPGLTPAQRDTVCSAALQAVRAVGYLGAGTVEFILDPGGEFYFLEMNTRLQVEHAVTELITGIDLVEWQLRIAAGKKLPLEQRQLAVNGHAIEARLYAEDPARDFLPATGTLRHLRFPDESASVRVDTGVRQGDEVSIHYDPMLAKLVAWGTDRPSALRTLQHMLQATEVVGVTTNLGLLAAIISQAEFVAGPVDTGFIAWHRERLMAAGEPPAELPYLAALYVLLQREADAEQAAAASAEPGSPWHQASGWWLNAGCEQRLRLIRDGTGVTVAATGNPGSPASPGWTMRVADGPASVVMGTLQGARLVADIDGHRRELQVLRDRDSLTILDAGRQYRLLLADAAASNADAVAATGGLSAPMPGRIVAVHVATGQAVRRGAALLVLEAMKMEHTITAPADGTIVELRFAPGDFVEEGDELLVLGDAGAD